MASIVIAGDTSGSVTLQAPAVAGSTVLNLPSTSGTIQTSGAGYTTNGVAYATSTSALSTGSALTFDGQYLGIGTGASSPNGIKFFANGGGLAANLTVNHSTGEIQNFAATNYFQTWYANNSERMRLDSSGNLLVGTTNSAQNASNGAKILPRGNVSVVNDGSTGGGDGFDFYNSTASAYRFYVTGAGVINATNTTITAISDQRLKENIVDLDVGLDAIMALKPRKFDWKAGKGKDIKGDRGWIAQEFETVFPDLIDTWKDPAPEGEEPYKSVRADLIPILVKAIQEQQALINTLTNRISVLENK